MFTEDELQLLKDENLIDCETRLLKAFGCKKNNKVTMIQLDDETLNLDEFVQFLYFPEWRVLQGFMTDNLPENCEFKIEGIVMRCANGVGTLGLTSISSENLT